MGLVSDRTVSPTACYCMIEGRAAEIARSLGSPAGLDAPLRRALADALPDGTTFALGSEDERVWVCVLGAGSRSDPALPRQVLNAALTSLNRPPADGRRASSPCR